MSGVVEKRLTDQTDTTLTDEGGAGLAYDIVAPYLPTDQAGPAPVQRLTDQTDTTLTDEVGLALGDDVVSLSPLTDQTFVAITDENDVEVGFDVVTPIPLSARGWQVFYAMDLLPYEAGGTGHLRASDLGYRTLPSDEGGVRVYPPALETAFEIDRLVGLDPGSANTATFGSVRLNNLQFQYDDYIASRNSDSRIIQINVGLKSYDRARGIYVDPSINSLTTLFAGYAMPWQLSEEQLEIPLRDVTYWADRPIQTKLYTGTGVEGGGLDLTGKPIPMTRGGTAAAPIRNVPLVLVDPIKLIYQWTDGPGTIVNLYEGGSAVFSDDGTVPPILSSADPRALWDANQPAPGHYFTDNLRGIVRMGSQPVNQLTADVTGAFPVAGFKTTAASIALYLLSETLGQPANMLDTISFNNADIPHPYTAGFFVGLEDTRALDVLNLLADSVGARLIPSRNGSLKLFLLRQMPFGTAPKALLTMQNVIDVTPQALPKNLDPPTSVWKVGHSLNNTVMTSGLNGTLNPAQKAVLASTYQYATWSDATVDTQYPSSNKPPPVSTYLLQAFDASGLADELGRLFGARAGLYAVEVPMDIATGLDIGDFVQVTWPLGGLRTGQIGQIVGEQIRSYDASATFTVLATNASSTNPFTVGVSTAGGADTLL